MLNSVLCLLVLNTVGFLITFGPEIRIDDHEDPVTGGIEMIQLSNGRYIVTWVGRRSESENCNVWCSYSDDFGETWSSSVQINEESAVALVVPQVCSASNGKLFAVWEDWRGPDVIAAYFNRSETGGESWLASDIQISDEGKDAYDPSISSNCDGSVLVAVFLRLSEKRIYGSYSLDGGDTWSQDVPVGDDTPASQYYPIVRYAGEETFVALWKDKRDTSTFIYSSVSDDGGQTWSADVPVPSGGNQPFEGPAMFWDGSVLHAFWIENFNLLDSTNSQAFYSRSEDSGKSWLESAVQIDDLGRNNQMMRGGIWASDPANIFSVWCSMRNQSYPIYAVCSMSIDSGKTWSDTIRANSESGEGGRVSVFGDNASGDVLVAWSNLSNQQIMCSRGSDYTGCSNPDEGEEVSVDRNPSTDSFSFSLPHVLVPVDLCIYDMSGRRVHTIHCNDPGDYTWLPSEEESSGIFLVRCSSGEEDFVSSIVLLR